MIFGVGIGYYYVMKHSLTATMMVGKNPSIYVMEMFLKYIHMATSGYLFIYFSAMLAAYAVCSGALDPYAKKVNHVFWLSGLIITANIAQYAPIISNSTLQIIGTDSIPLFVVTVRIVVAIELIFMCIYLSLLDMGVKNKEKEEESRKGLGNNDLKSIRNNNEDNDQEKSSPKKHFSVVKAIFRLSFAIYMSNYLFIRTDFYTSRMVFYTSLWVYVSIYIKQSITF